MNNLFVLFYASENKYFIKSNKEGSFLSFSLDDSGKLANASDLSVTADERKWSVLSAEEVFGSVLVVVRDDGSPV
ncbi:Aspartyl/glutamyl-tRNA(Asn/Gln) amidotransferase subunit [Trichinella spiralis]|uniref:Aspartyl/glutamyl-tRNA(Asn/Gln) amidotransferase subunit n=1 Tax=Trichinella spiralis TaxID=6334 RepID=A0ABR3KRS7_TRISP